MRRDVLGVVVPSALVGLFLGLRRGELPLGDSDVLWATRAGADMLTTGSLSRHATHSWTAAGHTWTPNSWGWDVVLGAAHDLGGMRAIAVVGAIVTTVLGAVVALAARRVGSTAAWTAVVYAAVGLFVIADLRPRPQVVAYIMVFVLPMFVRPALLGPRRQALQAAVAIAAVQIVWMNLHSSAVIGPVMVAAGGAGMLLARRPETSRESIARLFGIVALSAVCCLATPYGTALITNIQQVRDASVGLIDEWKPIGFSGSGPILGIVAIVVACAAGWGAARARRYDTIGYLLVFSAATAAAVRFTPILFLLAIPEAAALLSRLAVRPQFMTRVVAAGCLVLGAFALVGASNFGKLDNAVASPKLAALIPHGCRTVNDYTMGGALLLERPDVAVSVDSRNDMYGRHLLLRVEGWLQHDKDALATLDQNHVDCVLTMTKDKLVSKLMSSPAWRVAGHDSVRTLFVRISS